LLKTPFSSFYGVVAAETPIASYIGAKILEQGGNFVDATIATSLALAITVQHLGGLGGDFFALLRSTDGKVYFINGSGYAPRKLTIDLLLKKGFTEMPSYGPLSIVVPGIVDALRVLSEKFSNMEWEHIVKYVIEKLKKGFPMTESLARTLSTMKDDLIKDPGSKETYYSVLKNDVARSGDPIMFPNMIKTLELISEDPRIFYEGEIAESICNYVQSLGGVLDIEDLKGYHAFFDEPLKLELENITVFEMPPNTQGITTLHLLKMLCNTEIGNARSSKRIRVFLENFKVAYWIRDNYVSDPRDMKVKVHELLSDKFIDSVAHEVRGMNVSKVEGDTTYFAIADQEGNIISAIQSLFYPFGSRVTEPKYGITLNSRASSFFLKRDHVNSLKPRKRPLHTLSAMIIEDQNRILSLGLSGGHFRPQLHAEIFTNIYKYEFEIQKALDHQRFVWYPWTKKVDVEEGLDTTGLEGYMINVVPYPSRLGVAAAVEIKSSGVRVGYCDIRGDGIPIGLV